MYPLGWDPGAEHGCRDCMLLGWQLGGVSGRAAASPGSPAWLLALHIGCRRLLPRASECPVRGAGGAEALLFMMQDAQPPALLVSGGCRWLLQADLQPQAWVSNNGSGVYGGSGVVSRVHLYLLRAKLPGKVGKKLPLGHDQGKTLGQRQRDQEAQVNFHLTAGTCTYLQNR